MHTNRRTVVHLHRLLTRVLTLAACAAAAAGCGRGQPAEHVVSQPRAAPPTTSTTVADDDQAPVPVAGSLVVDVAGQVQQPGVYELPAGARVHEAIEAAGGLLPNADVSSINRAALVTDGQQVLVPKRGGTGADGAGGAAGGAAGAAAGRGTSISINQADAQQLQELPGVGPVTAERIVAERESGGPFATVDDLDRVPGIGPATIDALREVATA